MSGRVGGRTVIRTRWQSEYDARLTTAEEAVRLVRPGDRVVIPVGSNPMALAEALAARAAELESVEVLHSGAWLAYPWFAGGYEKAFQVKHEHWISPRGRPRVQAGQDDFVPFLFSKRFKGLERGRTLEESRRPDVVFVQVAPPDDDGYLNLGPNVWNQRRYIRLARVAVAEVNPAIPPCCGDTRIHISEFSRLVMAEARLPPARDFPADPYAERIAEYVGEILEDGDTLQIGFGRISYGLARTGIWRHFRDLGWHSEATPPGVLDLIREGIINGERKSIDRGVAVATQLGVRQEHTEFVRLNPRFSVRECSRVLDPQIIARNKRMVSINSALAVDLTGQIAAESMGPIMIGGAGGQLEFAVGALLSPGGRAITVLRSVTDEGTSRIVATLPAGTVVTVPRLFADIVITEYGMARLLGKSARERAAELIRIAHPEHRRDLLREAERAYGA